MDGCQLFMMTSGRFTCFFEALTLAANAAAAAAAAVDDDGLRSFRLALAAIMQEPRCVFSCMCV